MPKAAFEKHARGPSLYPGSGIGINGGVPHARGRRSESRACENYRVSKCKYRTVSVLWTHMSVRGKLDGYKRSARAFSGVAAQLEDQEAKLKVRCCICITLTAQPWPPPRQGEIAGL